MKNCYNDDNAICTKGQEYYAHDTPEKKDCKCKQSKNEIEQKLLTVCAENEEMREEMQAYRSAARLYGVDPNTMLNLAKSKIKTSADNIRIMEKIQEILMVFDCIPENLTEKDVSSAIIHYDGDNQKPYCDLVYYGLIIIRDYLAKRREYDEWRMGNLPKSF